MVSKLLDFLSYKREVLTQMLLVATILGAFSMSGVVALLVGPHRDRLHRFLFVTLCLASLAFIFATALDAILLPVTGRKTNASLPPQKLAGLLALGDVVIWSMIAGALALMVAMGGFGFAFSRRLGWLSAGAAALAVSLLILEFLNLAALAN
jgi:hypothetical protein